MSPSPSFLPFSSHRSHSSSPPLVAVFDSGLGGISVLKALAALAPYVSLLYLDDSGFGPYGERNEAFISSRTVALGQTLHHVGATAVVVACNTATAHGIEILRAALPIPVVGVEPAVKPAASLTRSKKIYLLATQRTLGSERLQRLVDRWAGECEIFLDSAPEWVTWVDSSTEATIPQELLTEKVTAIRSSGADVVVLGCTHYSFFSSQLGYSLGADFCILDPAEAVAKEVICRLGLGPERVAAAPNAPSRAVFYTTSSSVAQVSNACKKLFGA